MLIVDRPRLLGIGGIQITDLIVIYRAWRDDAELQGRAVVYQRFYRRARTSVRRRRSVKRQVHVLLAVAALHRRYRTRLGVDNDHRPVRFLRVIGQRFRVRLEQILILEGLVQYRLRSGFERGIDLIASVIYESGGEAPGDAP